MRRAANLFEGIVAPDNLLDAYLKARQGKQHRPDVVFFSKRLDVSLAALREKLCHGTYRCDQYRQFTIHDPKERVISVAPFEDRVMHHAVMNRCGPVFERHQIFDSYACRPQKGTLAALVRATRFTRRFPFFLKLDVRHYFSTIAHDRLSSQLGRLFKDRRLLALLDEVIAGYGRFTGSPDTGLPIGNLTSQYFANHYLSGLDHWIKESLRVPGYVRYMDDMVLFGASVSELSAWETEIRTSVASRLGLELKPGILNRTQEGLPFLGFVLTPMGARLSSRSSRRVRRNVRTVTALLTSGRISQATAGDRVRAMLARTDWTGDGARTRRRLLGRCSRRRTASTAAAAGTTTPGGVAPPTATGTTRATAGTTRGSGSSSPTARGKGWMSPVEQSSGPVPACGGKSAKGGPVLVAAAAPPVERSGPPAFFKPPQGETE